MTFSLRLLGPQHKYVSGEVSDCFVHTACLYLPANIFTVCSVDEFWDDVLVKACLRFIQAVRRRIEWSVLFFVHRFLGYTKTEAWFPLSHPTLSSIEWANFTWGWLQSTVYVPQLMSNWGKLWLSISVLSLHSMSRRFGVNLLINKYLLLAFWCWRSCQAVKFIYIYYLIVNVCY